MPLKIPSKYYQKEEVFADLCQNYYKISEYSRGQFYMKKEFGIFLLKCYFQIFSSPEMIEQNL